MDSDLTDRDAAPAAAEGADAIRKALVAARHALSRECGHVPHDQGEALELVKAAERALAARPAPAAELKPGAENFNSDGEDEGDFNSPAPAAAPREGELFTAHPHQHSYQRDPQSNAGNCRCGWPERWGGEPPPIHGGRPWDNRERGARATGLQVVREAIARARGDAACPSLPIPWDRSEADAPAPAPPRAGYDTPGVGHEGDLWSIPEMAGLAEEVHAAWRDGMLNQGREVASERRQWETLDPLDHGLDRYIAQRLLLFVRSVGLDGYAGRAAAREAARGEGDTNDL